MKIFTVLSILITFNSSAFSISKNGTYYGSWGYNRSQYTNSNISLKGNSYNYTLKDVKASDRQSEFGSVYFTDITIPQFDFQFGYFFTENESISIGLNHMKYVVDSDQSVEISGTDHNGSNHNSDDIDIEGFLEFEHTDGLNYINAVYEYSHPITIKEYTFFLVMGGGLGFLLPRTNVKFIDYKSRHDNFKFSGFGLDSHVAFDFYFFDRYFFKAEAKFGYINMPWIGTTESYSDSASQQFGFAKYLFAVGLNI